VKSCEIPSKFVDYLIEAAGSRSASIVLDAIREASPTTSVRINPLKVTDLAALGLPVGRQIPWCNDGLYLKVRPQFTMDPAFHAGAYYVQEPSSMFLAVLEPVFEKLRPMEILDLCAAPGGKSTHLISMAMRHYAADAAQTASPHEECGAYQMAPAAPHPFNVSPHITCNEVIKTRVGVLAENVAKWGVQSVSVTNHDPSWFKSDGQTFDFILVDAPCSGEGMFRKDPDAISEWSVENVKLCAARQQRILSDIWDTLVPGGILAYSTCTFNRIENDGNLRWLKTELGALPFDILKFYQDNYSDNSAVTPLLSKEMIESWGIVITPEGGFQFFPGLVEGEGFYLALVRKPFEGDIIEQVDKTIVTYADYPCFSEHIGNKLAKQEKNLKRKISGQQVQNERLSIKYSQEKHNKSGNAAGQNFSDKQSGKLSNKIKTSSDQQDINQLIQPDHKYALSIDYAGEWPSMEIARADALTYLSRNAIILKDAPMGYVRVTYHGFGLGFVKNLGNRANNLYPKNWRIRKDIEL